MDQLVNNVNQSMGVTPEGVIEIDWAKWSDLARAICESSDMMKNPDRENAAAEAKN